MRNESLSYQWNNSKSISFNDILLIFAIPQLIYAVLYLLNMFEYSFELMIIAISSSIFALVSTYLSRNHTVYRLMIKGLSIYIEILDRSTDSKGDIKTVESIRQNRFIDKINIKTSFNINEVMKIQEKRNSLIFVLQDQRKVELSTDGIDEHVIHEMIEHLRECHEASLQKN